MLWYTEVSERNYITDHFTIIIYYKYVMVNLEWIVHIVTTYISDSILQTIDHSIISLYSYNFKPKLNQSRSNYVMYILLITCHVVLALEPVRCCLPSGLGMCVTKPISSVPLFSRLLTIVKTLVTCLTHWGRDEIDAILQTTSSSAFSWMKMFEFRLKFHWSSFLRVQLTIIQYWFR